MSICQSTEWNQKLDLLEQDCEWQWHQLGICKSATRHRQITMPASHHSVFLQAGCPFCPNQQYQSTECTIDLIVNMLIHACAIFLTVCFSLFLFILVFVIFFWFWCSAVDKTDSYVNFQHFISLLYCKNQLHPKNKKQWPLKHHLNATHQ